MGIVNCLTFDIVSNAENKCISSGVFFDYGYFIYVLVFYKWSIFDIFFIMSIYYLFVDKQHTISENEANLL